jgi:surface protein
MSSPFLLNSGQTSTDNGNFVEADSCSVCPVGTTTIPATFIPNDEIRCFYDKMPDGCKGVTSLSDRSCDPRKAVDELIALNADGSGIHPTYGPIKDWDLTLVTDLSWLFNNKKTMNADLSNWDVSGVTNMRGST